jgi:hypothetical protein
MIKLSRCSNFGIEALQTGSPILAYGKGRFSRELTLITSTLFRLIVMVRHSFLRMISALIYGMITLQRPDFDRHTNISHETFGIVDIKPDDMEELTEVITCSEFHPKECSQLIYATSKGIVRLCDLRDSALCKT